jgi:hypothetical protein
MQIAQEEPIIEIIDAPILPLNVDKIGKVFGIILGSFCSGIFYLLWLVLKLILKFTFN